MQNKVPPPVWMLLFGIAMWLIARSDFAYPIDVPYRWLFSAIFIAVGLSFTVPAIRHFREADTTINPLKPGEASKLVTNGVFAVSRNPMYVGLLMVLVAWGVWLGESINLVTLAMFVLVITTFQIKPEERALRELFGEEYDEYCRNVRRWL